MDRAPPCRSVGRAMACQCLLAAVKAAVRALAVATQLRLALRPARPAALHFPSVYPVSKHPLFSFAALPTSDGRLWAVPGQAGQVRG